MKIISTIVGLLCVFTINAQQSYLIIDGPSSFMSLNQAGNEFVSADFNADKGNYTFTYSQTDDACPWSVVSEYGTNIYTKLDLGVANSFNEIYLLTPALQLSNTDKYSYSQTIFGIPNKVNDPQLETILKLKMIAGNPKEFTPALLENTEILAQMSIKTSTITELNADNFTPQLSGAYYFALHIGSTNFQVGNNTTMSLGFKKNTVIRAVHTAIQTNSIQSVGAYPNPTSGQIRFSDFLGDVEILNEPGLVVMKFVNYQEKSIDVSGLQPGVYFARNKNLVKKFLKK